MSSVFEKTNNTNQNYYPFRRIIFGGDIVDNTELSLQSLYDILKTKSDNTHTHTFIGSIESALSLQGVHYSEFLRNTLKDQQIKAYYDEVTFGVASKNTEFIIKSKNNRAESEINNKNLSTHNLRIAGHENEDVVVAIQGRLLINGVQALTIDDEGKITGIDTKKLDLEGKGILVTPDEPTKKSNGTIWGKMIESDVVLDDTAIANNTMYTVPVGTILRTLSSSIPNGYLKANGQVVSRAGYKGLWDFAKTRSVLVTDAEWKSSYADSTSMVQKYSYGNGSTNFRLPNIPTDDDTIYMIKAYDELTTASQASISGLEDNVKSLMNNKVITGVGFFKFADGGLIQYGVAVGNVCYFTLPFVDTQYSIQTNYEGNAVGVDISITAKQTNKCGVVVTNSGGLLLGNAKMNFVAMGRWK